MRKTYKGTNTEDVKVWGVPFKKGEIIEVEVIDEQCTHTYRDSVSGGLYGEIGQIQQINVRTKKDIYCITAPRWGYMHHEDKRYIEQQKKNFKEDVDAVISKMVLEKK